MMAELDAIRSQIDQNDSKVWRRAYCKSLFSFLEGASFLLKREIVLMREGEGWDLEGRDAWVLTESRPAQTTDGKEIRRPFFLPTLDNLTYALEKFAYWNWSDYRIDKKSAEWSNLCEASRIRNRITHPKSSTDLFISDKELSILHRATEDFKNLVAETFKNSAFALFRMARAYFRGSTEDYWKAIRKSVTEAMADE